MRAKQKDNSPIRGRRNPASKKLLFKNVFTVWLGRPRIRASAWKVGRLPPFSACVRPPPTAPRRFIWRRRNRSRRARHGVLRATRPPHSRVAGRGCVCANTGGEGRVRGRRKPRVRFSRQPFQTFSAHSRWGGRIAEKTPCRTPATLAVDSIVVD